MDIYKLYIYINYYVQNDTLISEIGLQKKFVAYLKVLKILRNYFSVYNNT